MCGISLRSLCKRSCLQLGWLPLIERRSYQLLQCVFKALHFDYWPQYLKLEQYIRTRNLRSSCEVKLKVPIENGTFQDSSAALFNALASYLRNCTDIRSFKRNLTSYLVNNARKRLEVTSISSHLHFSSFIFQFLNLECGVIVNYIIPCFLCN